MSSEEEAGKEEQQEAEGEPQKRNIVPHDHNDASERLEEIGKTLLPPNATKYDSTNTGKQLTKEQIYDLEALQDVPVDDLTHTLLHGGEWWQRQKFESQANHELHTNLRSYFTPEVTHHIAQHHDLPRDPLKKKELKKKRDFFVNGRDAKFSDQHREKGWDGRAGITAALMSQVAFRYKKYSDGGLDRGVRSYGFADAHVNFIGDGPQQMLPHIEQPYLPRRSKHPISSFIANDMKVPQSQLFKNEGVSRPITSPHSREAALTDPHCSYWRTTSRNTYRKLKNQANNSVKESREENSVLLKHGTLSPRAVGGWDARFHVLKSKDNHKLHPLYREFFDKPVMS